MQPLAEGLTENKHQTFLFIFCYIYVIQGRPSQSGFLVLRFLADKSTYIDFLFLENQNSFAMTGPWRERGSKMFKNCPHGLWMTTQFEMDDSVEAKSPEFCFRGYFGTDWCDDFTLCSFSWIVIISFEHFQMLTTQLILTKIYLNF